MPRAPWFFALIGSLSAIVLAGSPAEAAPGHATPPAASKVRLSPDGRTASLTLDVLTYNIEGVPARGGRKAKLQEIGARLQALHEAGEGPDIVLFQEMFSRAAKEGVARARYPHLVTGPARKDRRSLPAWGDRKGRQWRKGEWGLRLVGSGLAIASIHPIEAHASEPFSRRACAGFDCLSNKGTLFARIRVAGAPEPVDLFNTHMNAQQASRVRTSRHTRVHHAQVRELADFMAEHHDPANPVLLGGDFNMRRSETRFETFQARSQPLQLVHQVCRDPAAACAVELSWDGDAPWMDTQDLQLFRSGALVSVRPLRVMAMFDGRPESPSLSDHDGLRVVYELSWLVDSVRNEPARLPVASTKPKQLKEPSPT